MKGNFVFLWLLLMLLESPADGATFKGKVIDADTKEPIEGAAVVAVWGEETTTPTATHSRLKDVKEVLTDKNGEWLIMGPKGGEVGNIKAIISVLTGTYFTLPPAFIVFKPGYCSWPERFGIEVCKQRMKPFSVGEGETLELPTLTRREDRLKALPSPIEKEGDRKKEFYKKQKILLRLIDDERRFLGIPEFQILRELENEK
jgi:hypothetical protein